MVVHMFNRGKVNIFSQSCTNGGKYMISEITCLTSLLTAGRWSSLDKHMDLVLGGGPTWCRAPVKHHRRGGVDFNI